MRFRHALAASLALGLAFVAQAEDKKPAKDAARAPYNVFEHAAEGDWSACQITDGTKGDPTLVTWTVTKIEGDKITIASEERRGGKARKPKEGSFDKKEAPTVFALMQPHDQDTPGSPDAKVTEEKKKVGDHEFACKKVTFSMAEGDRLKLELEVWFATEVKSTGIVAFTMKEKTAKSERTFAGELVGFGNKDKAAWGKTPDEVQKVTK